MIKGNKAKKSSELPYCPGLREIMDSLDSGRERRDATSVKQVTEIFELLSTKNAYFWPIGQPILMHMNERGLEVLHVLLVIPAGNEDIIKVDEGTIQCTPF